MSKLLAITLLVIMLLAFLPVHETSAQAGCYSVNHTCNADNHATPASNASLHRQPLPADRTVYHPLT